MDSASAAWPLNGSGSQEKAGAGEQLAGRFSTMWTVALAVLMALLIVATVVGNALVMLAFVVDSSLRTQNNYFLLNLAISDFLVGKVPHLGFTSLLPPGEMFFWLQCTSLPPPPPQKKTPQVDQDELVCL